MGGNGGGGGTGVAGTGIDLSRGQEWGRYRQAQIGSWILTSCQPHRVIAGGTNTIVYMNIHMPSSFSCLHPVS